MNRVGLSLPVVEGGQDMDGVTPSSCPTEVGAYSRLRRSTNISHDCQDRRLPCGNAAAIFLAYYAAMPHNP